jgi:hypothetical protein
MPVSNFGQNAKLRDLVKDSLLDAKTLSIRNAEIIQDNFFIVWRRQNEIENRLSQLEKENA